MSSLREHRFSDRYRAVVVHDDGEPIRVRYELNVPDALGNDAWRECVIESKTSASLPLMLARYLDQVVIDAAYKPEPVKAEPVREAPRAGVDPSVIALALRKRAAMFKGNVERGRALEEAAKIVEGFAGNGVPAAVSARGKI